MTKSKDLSMLTGAFSATTRKVRGNAALGLRLFWGSAPRTDPAAIFGAVGMAAPTSRRRGRAAAAGRVATIPATIATVAAAAVAAAITAGLAASAGPTVAEPAVRKPRKKRSVSGVPGSGPGPEAHRTIGGDVASVAAAAVAAAVTAGLVATSGPTVGEAAVRKPRKKRSVASVEQS